MEEETIFEIIHNMDQFTNNLIVEWNKTFNQELGVSHVLILGHLNLYGKQRLSDIAKVIGLTPPTVTHLSDKLVKKDLRLVVKMKKTAVLSIWGLRTLEKKCLGVQTVKDKCYAENYSKNYRLKNVGKCCIFIKN